MKPQTIIRIILTLALLFGVYQETGIFTMIALALSALHSELIGHVLTKNKKE